MKHKAIATFDNGGIIYKAIEMGDLAYIKACFNKDNVNAMVVDNRPAIVLAAKFGQKSIIDHLSSLNANINASSADEVQNSTLPYILEYAKDVSTMEHLISLKADVNCKDYAGVTPIMRACAGSNIGKIQSLIMHGADLTIPDRDGKTTLQWLEHENYSHLKPFVMDALNKSQPSEEPQPPMADESSAANPILESHNGFGLKSIEIFKAIEMGDLAYIKACFNKDNVNAMVVNNRPAIVLAAKFGQKSIIDHLSSLNANINASSADEVQNSTLPYILEYAKDVSTMEHLISLKADVNCKDYAGVTPIMCALARSNIGKIQSLIMHGADLTIPDRDGKTTLQWLEHENYSHLKPFVMDALNKSQPSEEPQPPMADESSAAAGIEALQLPSPEEAEMHLSAVESAVHDLNCNL